MGHLNLNCFSTISLKCSSCGGRVFLPRSSRSDEQGWTRVSSFLAPRCTNKRLGTVRKITSPKHLPVQARIEERGNDKWETWDAPSVVSCRSVCPFDPENATHKKNTACIEANSEDNEACTSAEFKQNLTPSCRAFWRCDVYFCFRTQPPWNNQQILLTHFFLGNAAPSLYSLTSLFDYRWSFGVAEPWRTANLCVCVCMCVCVCVESLMQ